MFLFALSCKSLNDYQNQEVILNEGNSQNFSVENNTLLTNLFINHKKGVFLFDTGASSSVILNNNFIHNFSLNKNNYYTSIRVVGATGVTIESKTFISDSISSTIFLGKKNIFKHFLVQNNKISCVNSDTFKDGILGLDVFKRSRQRILLNFENNSIEVLKTNYDTKGFHKIDAKVPTNFGSKITIPFFVDGIKTNFLFDTGNAGGFLIQEKKNKIKDEKLITECETYISSVDRMTNEKIKFYKNVSIKHNNIINISSNVTVLPKLQTNTLGVAFIKNFNWLIDFSTGSIYVKRISNYENSNNLVHERLKSGVVNDKLIIVFKNLAYSLKQNLGDQITSVNNIKVSSENICEMQNLLNETKDWSNLKLEIIPSIK